MKQVNKVRLGDHTGLSDFFFHWKEIFRQVPDSRNIESGNLFYLMAVSALARHPLVTLSILVATNAT